MVFWSAATNLIVGDTNNTWDIYRKDTLTGQVSRYSTNSSGAQSNGASDYPFISADGVYVAFASQATNLVSGDNNNTWDVFLTSKGL